MEEQDDEIYKCCPSCGKLIKWEAVICPQCGVQIKDLETTNTVINKPSGNNEIIKAENNQNFPNNPEIHIRVTQEPNPNIGLGMEYALHSAKSFIGYAWLTIFLYIFAFWIGGLITNIVYLNSAIATRRIIKRDPPGFVFLKAILIYANLGIIFGVISVASIIPKATHLNTTTLTQTTVTVKNIAATTVKDLPYEEKATEVLPSIKLEIYEGPLYTEDGSICYYRIKANVTGLPTPTVKFSKDDSSGNLGKNKAQINLYNKDESHTLTATATNSLGKASDSINLTWIEK